MQEKMTRGEHRWPHMALLSLCALSIALVTRDSAFLGDDLTLVRAGQHMAEQDFWRPFLKPWIWQDIAKDWPPSTYDYFRPLVLATFAMDYLLWGFEPLGYLITNAGLHVACTLLVYTLARRLFVGAPPLAALIAGAVFALNSGQMFAVLWISARTDSLCALFYLASVIQFLKSCQDGGRVPWLLASLFAALAIVSKEMAYTLPLVCVAVYAVVHWPKRPFFAWLRGAAIMTAPMFAVSGALFLSRFSIVRSGAIASDFNIGLIQRAGTLARELRALFLPFDLPLKAYIVEHGVLTALFVLVGLGLTLVLLPRLWHRNSLFAAAWILLTLLPVMNVYNPWYLYVPCIGLALGAGWVFGAQREGRAAWAGAVGVLVLLGAYVAEIDARAKAWSEAGRLANVIASDYQRLAGTAALRPIFLSMPGELQGIPLYNHNLDARLRVEAAHPNVDAAVAGYLSVPTNLDAHGVSVHKVGDEEWIVRTLSEESHFIFPSYPQDSFSREWGNFEVADEDARGLPRALRIRLKPRILAERPLYYYSGGRLLPAETGAPVL